MREKIMEYTPIVKWVPVKTHYIADALSRSLPGLTQMRASTPSIVITKAFNLLGIASKKGQNLHSMQNYRRP